MRKIATMLLGLTLIPSCQMDQTLSSSMEKAGSTHVADDIKAFVQALKDEKFEEAQSMIQDGEINVNEKVDIRAISELAKDLSADKAEALLPLQVAAYWGDESLIKFVWEQAPGLYTKQDIDLALEIAMSGDNYDARAGLLSIVSENFSGEGSSHEKTVDVGDEGPDGYEKDIEADTGKLQKDIEEDNTGKMQQDAEDNTGKMQQDAENNTGKMQQDTEDNTGKMQQDTEDNTGKMQQDAEDNTGKMQQDAEDDTGKMQQDAEDNTGKMQQDAEDDTGKMQKDTE